MPIPSSISDLSQTAGSNSPAGSESPSLIDDYLRTYASYIALLRDQNSTTPQTIASAALTDIGSALTNVIIISGASTITALGTAAAGVMRTVRFSGALILTHNATSLILPGNLNITTAANDSAEFQSLGSGNWICVRYTLANTKPAPVLGVVSQTGGAPTGALMEYVSNANGEAWKYANGALVMTKSFPGDLSAGVPANSSALGALLSFPVSPAGLASGYRGATGFLTDAAGNVNAHAFTDAALGANGWRIAFLNLSPVASTRVVNLTYIYIGRWF